MKFHAVLTALTLMAAVAAPANPAQVDRIRGDQWHLPYLKVTEAHRITQGEGTVIAVPDTGVTPHPDLRNNLLKGTDVIEGGAGDGRQDRSSHGTGMAGLIAAHGRGTNSGALGIAPRGKILPILGRIKNEQGNSDHLAAAIEYSTSKNVDVIAIPSSAGASGRLQSAIDAALAANIVVVAAAGNYPDDFVVGYPARHPGVIAVGGVDRNGNHAEVSVTGREIDVVAPATDIYSTSINGKYRKGTGTSDSTAIVAGAVALIRAKFPELSAEEVAHRLTATAVDKGAPGRDDQYGYGVIDLVAALTADVPPLAGGSPTASAPAGVTPTTAVAAPTEEDDGNGWLLVTAGLAAVVGGLVALGGLAWVLLARRRRQDQWGTRPDD